MTTCYISKKPINENQCINASVLRDGIFELIKKTHNGFSRDHFISLDELNHFRRLYLTSLINQEKAELDVIDSDVLKAIKNNTILSENIQEITESKLTLGQKLADKIAAFGGSWTFIIAFFSFIIVWMLINIVLLMAKPFDPYPFILLNLILSCLAAIQAPIIMMSQNRREERDRTRNENDYKINLKAELEIKLLSEKIDHLLVHQNKILLEVQEVQTDYLEDLIKEIKNITK